MLALHLLQNCMVYINTLMLQQVLAQPKWADKLSNISFAQRFSDDQFHNISQRKLI
jgi:hypothetical protein